RRFCRANRKTGDSVETANPLGHATAIPDWRSHSAPLPHGARLNGRRREMKKYYVVLLTVASLWLGNLAASPAKVNYHLLKKIPLGAAPGGGEYFDYITFDPSTRRLYLTHGTEVKVVDADSGDVVGTIP